MAAKIEEKKEAAESNALFSAIAERLSKLAAEPLAPALYLVATPIGNLGDISIRALAILATADFLYCEDTRHSRKLLSAYGIHRKIAAYHDFSQEKDRQKIVSAVEVGHSVALISDAGTPLISDPGFKLVQAVREKGLKIFAIPGPSSPLAGLIVSGLPSDRFFFGGFLPPKEMARAEALEALRDVPGTLVFFETAPRLADTLGVLARSFADRTVVVARELTKLHEETLSGTPEELLLLIRESPPRGEIVLMIGPPAAREYSMEDIENALRPALARRTLKEAVESVAKELGVARKMVYNLALQIRKAE